jgi:tetratricopeptide (TPR) repeat protein
VNWRRTPIVLALALAIGAAYWSGLRAPFQFDDGDAIVENAAIRHWWPFAQDLPMSTQVAGRPVVALSYAVNFQLAGLDPFGYRVVNLLIHFACAVLLFAIARDAVARAHSAPHAEWMAAAIAMLWAVHPLNVGTITYVSARSEALASAVYLSVLWASLRAHGATHRLAWSAVAVAACAIGMATKETMVTAPVLVVLFDRAFYYSSFSDAVRDRSRLYSALAATWIVLGAVSWSAPRAASAGFDVGVSPWTYLSNQGPIVTDYLRTAFWPVGLVFTYGEPRPLDLVSVWPFVALIVLLFAATVWAWWRKPALGFPAVAFFLLLAPTSTIVPIATEVGAERRMYLPLAALIALVVVAIAAVGRRATRPAFVLLTLLLIALTSRRNTDYLTTEALWRSTVSSWPSAVAHRNLATSLKLAGKRDEALEQFRIAAQDRPEVRRIVGQELFELGRFDEAIDELRFFLATADPAGEDARASHLLVGRSLLAKARTAEAANEFEAVVKAHPDDAAALRALADARLDLREFDQAVGLYRRYLSAQPGDTNALINLGIALLSVGDASNAIQTLRHATERDPASEKAHLNLAVALAQQGALAEAAEHASRAVALAPNDGRARELLQALSRKP